MPHIRGPAGSCLRAKRKQEWTTSTTALRRAYGPLTRLHDLWILLAWGGILAGIMLNTLFHRTCDAYTVFADPTAICQSFADFGLFLAAAFGAGLAMTDERVAAIGFLAAHGLATVLFLVFVQTPALLALSDPVISDAIFSRSLVMAVRYEFPFAILISLVGSTLGVFLGGRLERRAESRNV